MEVFACVAPGTACMNGTYLAGSAGGTAGAVAGSVSGAGAGVPGAASGVAGAAGSVGVGAGVTTGAAAGGVVSGTGASAGLLQAESVTRAAAANRKDIFMMFPLQKVDGRRWAVTWQAPESAEYTALVLQAASIALPPARPVSPCATRHRTKATGRGLSPGLS